MSAQPVEIKPIEPMTEAEQQKIQAPADLWSDSYAAKVAKQDFETAMRYRETNHDSRMRIADELYLGWVPQRFWEGTRQPRSSLAVYVAFSIIESLVPKEIGAIFGDYPPFECDPRPGTNPDEARAVLDLMLYQLEEAKVKEVLRRACKAKYIYGNSVVELNWKIEESERWRFYHQYSPVYRKINTTFFGSQKVPVSMKREVKREKYTRKINQPFLTNISLKDYYIDPNCPSPVCQDSRYDCVRTYMTIEELESYREQEGFNIPNHQTLLAMAKQKPLALGDSTKGAVEGIRGNSWWPAEDTSSDPAAKRVEIVRYTTADRMVWLANRETPIFNQPNTYGFINHFSMWYADIPDRWHALGICDVVEGDQRFQAALLNGRVDELALALHPSTIKRRGAQIPPAQFRRRPGNIMEVGDPEKDIIREQVSNITQNAYIESNASEVRVQKITGLADLVLYGTPGAGGNSANRTATGVNTQSQASGARITGLVEVVENTLIEPILYAWHTLNQKFLDPEQIQDILGVEGKSVKIDPLSVKNADVRFVFRASARMISRAQLMQTFPLVFQTLVNPVFMEGIAKLYQYKLNLIKIGKIVEEATGIRHIMGELFEPMSQQELQMLNAPPPDAMIKQQMQGQRLDAQTNVAEEKHSADAVKMLGERILDEMVAGTDSQNPGQ